MLSTYIQALLLTTLLAQAPIRPNPDGSITGIVKATDGKPAIGVRVTARPQPDSVFDINKGIAMSSIAQTDANGRYLLENIPPGRYYVAAGNIDLPTYYPGTLDVAGGKVLQITPRAALTAIDFTLADVSFTIAAAGEGRLPGYSIRLQIQIEDGGKIPRFSPNGIPLLQVRQPTGAGFMTMLPFISPSITVPFPNTDTDYDVRVLNVPEGYRLKSLTYGATNLLTNRMRVAATTIPLNTRSTPPSVLDMVARALSLPPTGIVPGGTLTTLAFAPDFIAVTLEPVPVPPVPGVRITGSGALASASVYLSGKTGFLYDDGTFEFRGVAPGLHAIIAPAGPTQTTPPIPPRGAVLVVGDKDISNIVLDSVPMLPRELPTSAPTNYLAGTKIPPVTVKGKLISGATQQPIRGVVTLVGSAAQLVYSVNPDGLFETPSLLPGSYLLTASVFDHYTVNETIVIGETDSSIEIQARPAF